VTQKVPPTVSVIIPTYNRAHLVGRAIRSVLSQTCQDFEIIVVDDGSTDDTEKVVSSFNDSRIRYFRHQTSSGGPTAARNTGIRVSRGKYVAFLDSDDEYLPQKLESQLEVFEHQSSTRTDLGFVMTGHFTFNDLGQVVVAFSPQDFERPYEELFARNHTAYHTMLVRRECFDHAGLYDENLPACENWDMAVRLGTRYGYAVIPNQLVAFHQHGGQHVGTMDNRCKALGILASKYSSEMKQYPKFGANLRLNIAADDLRKGLMAEARRQSIAAIRLHPSWYKGYIYFMCSLLGTRLYKVIAPAWQHLKASTGI